ncbi:Uu.00g009200.m01.CDS01 [Anthostomella pinea]|uniref:Uu.00g009200.m01.CDS01 n=1 Tax=Anthostomella pinea TaxID=933095 RepID=A0AAI8YQ15_9PEZI|nr:Uu.00g009200.m01.CDS01 [Anthostomella pinea]
MGHHNRHFAGDRYALSGAWSPPTSTANFCEEDYAVTRYLAEFINTLTNLIYVYLALRYMYSGPKSRGLFAPRTDFMSHSLLVLGVASFAFHATLRQTMQFADELGMLGIVWSLLQGLLTVSHASSSSPSSSSSSTSTSPSPTQNRSKQLKTNTALTLAFTLFAAFYVWTGKIIYHATGFWLILALIGLRGYHLLYRHAPPFAPEKRREWARRAARALVVLASGYILWQIDLEYCAELRALRARVGLPWAWAFELHGWWHILTGIAAARFMDIVREVRTELEKEKEKEV